MTPACQGYVCGSCSRLDGSFQELFGSFREREPLRGGSGSRLPQENFRWPASELWQRDVADWPAVRGRRRGRGLVAECHMALPRPLVSSTGMRQSARPLKVAVTRREEVSTRAAQMARAPKFKFWTMTAKSKEELRAAAILRAQLFYRYPPFTSTTSYPDDVRQRAKERVKHEYDVQDLLKARIRSEINRDAKMEFLGMRVTCLLAVCERPDAEALLSDSWHHGIMRWTERESHLATALTKPPEVPWKGHPMGIDTPLVAIGTLDIQVGKILPSEPLVGAYPPGERATYERGYIFNVCVIAAARGRGVGTTLMEEAADAAREMGLKVLYVHVEAENTSARRLYENLGYTIEQEEPLEFEKKFNRPRRLLLSYRIE